MTKRILLLVGAALPLLMIGTWVLRGDDATTVPGEKAFPDVGSSQSVDRPTGFTEVSLQSGERIVVSDLTTNSQTFDDETYHLTGIFEASNGIFSLSYYEPDDFFAVTLLSEPLDDARGQAEQAFLSRLGISETEACNLNVYVGVPITVNQYLAGENLGFSFCSDSLEL